MRHTYLFMVVTIILFYSCSQRQPQQKIETPQQAIEALRDGNIRFTNETAINITGGQSLSEITALAAGQNPFAAVVCCSDSRVPVELIFDCGFGDIFVIRTAGNSLCDDTTIGSLQYAISHLGVKAIVILGHSDCGAIKSIVHTDDGNHNQHNGDDKAEQENCELHSMLSKLSDGIDQYKGSPNMLQRAIEANVKVQTSQVMAWNKVKQMVDSEQLVVVSALYNLETGEVIFD